jgi:arylesterase/paraoxonase
MPHLPFRAAAVVVALAAVLYQYFAKSLIFDILGYGRVVQNVSAFSHLSCQKIDNLGLEGCEDMWLNDRNGFLYMSCSDSRSRVQWLPA